ncbi:hypothetical protein JN080_24440 [Bacillus sp. EB600]|nr:hypothetical protein [Bacillus sp. EB600]
MSRVHTQSMEKEFFLPELQNIIEQNTLAIKQKSFQQVKYTGTAVSSLVFETF